MPGLTIEPIGSAHGYLQQRLNLLFTHVLVSELADGPSLSYHVKHVLTHLYNPFLSGVNSMILAFSTRNPATRCRALFEIR